MKLELKHLAPYLPYRLKFRAKAEVWEMTSINTLDEFQVWAHNYWDEVKLVYYPSINNKGNFQGKGYRLNQVKPILRPLSNLMNTIKIKDKEITPYYFWDDEQRQHDLYLCSTDVCYVEYLEYFIVECLIEWHFDVFGLIEKGLAIDINTLNK